MADSLVKLDQATRMLAEIRSVDDAKQLIDLAEAARVYARQVDLGLEAQNYAAEIKLRAQRRAGEVLHEMQKAEGQGERGDDGRFHQRLEPPTAGDLPTYAELDIEKHAAHDWQAIATIPEGTFEAHIARTKAKGNELTTAGIVHVAKELKREEKREANRRLVQGTIPVQDASIPKCPTIVLDPPWDWGDEGDQDQFGRARPTYTTMTIDQIAALPVGELATDNAHIYLWITNRSLPKGFVLLEQWGFRYICILTWCKPSIGMGNYFRGSTEHVLFGVRGSLPLLRNDIGTWFQADRPGQHSGKPDKFYTLVEQCSPGPWLEMFQRRARPGWYGWGAEAGAKNL